MRSVGAAPALTDNDNGRYRSTNRSGLVQDRPKLFYVISDKNFEILYPFDQLWGQIRPKKHRILQDASYSGNGCQIKFKLFFSKNDI